MIDLMNAHAKTAPQPACSAAALVDLYDIVLASLRTRILAFCRDTGMTPTAFGAAAVNDGKFVPSLMNGRKPTPDLMRRVEVFMETRYAELSDVAKVAGEAA